MIRNSDGNLLAADVDALVNTVNTVGVMGKGIALQFKRAFPDMFKEYSRAAKRGDLQLGQMHVWPTGQLDGPTYIINFPTKAHWKSRSRLSDVESGLDDLVRVIKDLGIGSIAIPPLGCGHGGLDWADVEPLIRRKLAAVDTVEIQLYAPAGTPAAAEMKSSGKAPAMTPGRAALIAMLARYSTAAVDGATPIELQKLMYFLQEAGEDLRLTYVKHIYGPYADNLRHALSSVEGHYLLGFGDGSQRVEFADPIRLLPRAKELADYVVDQMPDTGERIERVMGLVAGYESTYSLELLATVYWLVKDKPELAEDSSSLISHLQAWSERKKLRFPPSHIESALSALHERGWIEQSVGQ